MNKNQSHYLALLTDYEREYLVHHLCEAVRLEDLFFLLTFETDQEKPAIFEARDQAGRTDRYLSDLVLGQQSSLQRASLVRDSGFIGFACAFAIMSSSVTSLASVISPTFLRASVERGTIGHSQAVTYALRIPNENERVDVATAIAPLLAPLLVDNLFKGLVAGERPEDLPGLIQKIATWIPEKRLEHVIRQLEEEYDERDLHRSVIAMLPRLSTAERTEWINDLVNVFVNPGWSFQEVAEIESVFNFANPQQRNAIAERCIQEGYFGYRALCVLANHIPALARRRYIAHLLPKANTDSYLEREAKAAIVALACACLSEPVLSGFSRFRHNIVQFIWPTTSSDEKRELAILVGTHLESAIREYQVGDRILSVVPSHFLEELLTQESIRTDLGLYALICAELIRRNEILDDDLLDVAWRRVVILLKRLFDIYTLARVVRRLWPVLTPDKKWHVAKAIQYGMEKTSHREASYLLNELMDCLVPSYVDLLAKRRDIGDVDTCQAVQVCCESYSSLRWHADSSKYIDETLFDVFYPSQGLAEQLRKEITNAMASAGDRSYALSTLVPALLRCDEHLRFALLAQVLTLLSDVDRKECVACIREMLPVIRSVGSVKDIDVLIHVLGLVQKWWP